MRNLEEKKEIRNYIRKLRREQSLGDWKAKTRQIAHIIVRHNWFIEAENIYCYMDFDKEAGTADIIKAAWRHGKNVYLPYTEKEGMEFYKITCFDELEKGALGIFEPKKKQLSRYQKAGSAEASRGLMIMPGTAFDRERNRIGYGGGYYDRYLRRYPKLHTIAAAFEFQIVSSIAAEETDEKPELIVTERGILQ